MTDLIVMLYMPVIAICVPAFQLCVNERVTATYINVLFAWTHIKTSNLKDYLNHFPTRPLLIILRWFFLLHMLTNYQYFVLCEKLFEEDLFFEAFMHLKM